MGRNGDTETVAVCQFPVSPSTDDDFIRMRISEWFAPVPVPARTQTNRVHLLLHANCKSQISTNEWKMCTDKSCEMQFFTFARNDLTHNDEILDGNKRVASHHGKIWDDGNNTGPQPSEFPVFSVFPSLFSAFAFVSRCSCWLRHTEVVANENGCMKVSHSNRDGQKNSMKNEKKCVWNKYHYLCNAMHIRLSIHIYTR